MATEQEGLGFLRAANTRPSIKTGIVRGISDLLSGKALSDARGGQKVAARNAAAFAAALLLLKNWSRVRQKERVPDGLSEIAGTAPTDVLPVIMESLLFEVLLLIHRPALSIEEVLSQIHERLERGRSKRLIEQHR